MSRPSDEDGSGLLFEIGAVLGESERLWAAQDYGGLRALWDSDEADPYYIAEEIDHTLIGWEAIEGYWRNNLTLIKSITVSYSNLEAKLVAPELAVAIYALRFDLQLTGPRAPIGGENRVTALFRRTEHGWRYCHYVEAPLSPIVYVRKLYERDVSKSFAAKSKD